MHKAIASVALAVGVFVLPGMANASPPGNDDFDSATLIGSLPFADSVDTASATQADDDPYCVGRGPTVWYSFTPDETTRVEANTFGSSYDTTLSVYTGSRGALDQVRCNDDWSGLQSRVDFQAAAGVTYYFMVGSFGSGPGGTLQLAINPAPADTTPPQLFLPGDLSVHAHDEAGAAVWYWASAWDEVDPNPAVECLPGSGALFPVGTTTVECTATDFSGNAATGRFDVTVTFVRDETPPVLVLPGDISVEASDETGAVVWYWAMAWDDVDGGVPVDCAPASGALFPVGTTTVECAATDFSGNTATGRFDVTVLPPLVLELRIDREGSVDPVTGVATLRGTVACSRPVGTGIWGGLTQRAGRTLISGYFFVHVECSAGQSPWSAQVTGQNGLFVAGSAEATAETWAGQFYSADATIRLRAQRR